MYKIIGADHKEYGPVSADQLRQWFAEGRVNGATRVQAEGTSEWKPISQVAEFAALFPAGGPPVVPSAPTTTFSTTPPTMSMPAPAHAPTSQMAVWSLVLGIIAMIPCCLPVIMGPIAIVLGAVALSNIKNTPGMKGHGFATAGIILGALGLLIGIILAVVLYNSPGLMQEMQNRLSQQQQ